MILILTNHKDHKNPCSIFNGTQIIMIVVMNYDFNPNKS